MSLNTLRGQIEYIEAHQPGLIVVACKMYRRRHIFEGDDGKLYVLKRGAGWDDFLSNEEALDSINSNPERYLIVGGRQ